MQFSLYFYNTCNLNSSYYRFLSFAISDSYIVCGEGGVANLNGEIKVNKKTRSSDYKGTVSENSWKNNSSILDVRQWSEMSIDMESTLAPRKTALVIILIVQLLLLPYTKSQTGFAQDRGLGLVFPTDESDQPEPLVNQVCLSIFWSSKLQWEKLCSTVYLTERPVE